MAMIRTRRLAWGTLTGTTAFSRPGAGPLLASGDVFTVPAGYRAIVRDHRFTTSDLGPEIFSAYTYARIGGITHYIDGANEVRVGGSKVAQIVCDVVLEAGDVYGVESNLSTFSYYITGALLILPA